AERRGGAPGGHGAGGVDDPVPVAGRGGLDVDGLGPRARGGVAQALGGAERVDAAVGADHPVAGAVGGARRAGAGARRRRRRGGGGRGRRRRGSGPGAAGGAALVERRGGGRGARGGGG